MMYFTKKFLFFLGLIMAPVALFLILEGSRFPSLSLSRSDIYALWVVFAEGVFLTGLGYRMMRYKTDIRIIPVSTFLLSQLAVYLNYKPWETLTDINAICFGCGVPLLIVSPAWIMMEYWQYKEGVAKADDALEFTMKRPDLFPPPKNQNT